MYDQDAERQVTTDTATLVIFDPASLVDRIEDEVDWWTGVGDLEAEEKSRRIVFIDVGSDGTYRLRIRVRSPEPNTMPVKSAHLLCPSGEIFFGAGECLPGDGEAIREFLGVLRVPPGEYKVTISSDAAEAGFTAYLSLSEFNPRT